MTINDVKKAYLEYGIKIKKNVPLDTEITIADIDNGTYFSKFKDNENLGLIINGLSIVDGEVAFVLPKVNAIEIQSDDIMPPCGGDLELIVNAIYGLLAIFMDGSSRLIAEMRKSPVVALISLDGDASFTYKRPYLSCDTINDSGENKQVSVTATYYNDRKQYKDIKTIIQTQNNYSSWLTVEETTDSIEVSVEGGRIPNKGGRAKIIVIREFARKMVKRDSCGNVSETKVDYGLLEDITSKSLITVDDKKNFRIYKDYIVAEGQLPDSGERTVVITARYGDKTGRVEVAQSEGEKTSYEYELTFENGEKMELLDMDTSLKTRKNIPLVSLKKKYVGDKFIEQRNTTYLSVTTESEWIEGSVIENDGIVYLSINVLEANNDRVFDREADVEISCVNDPNTKIRLVVVQPPMSVVNSGYEILVDGNGEYTTEELDAKRVSMKPYHVDTYEDGEKEYELLSDGYKMDLKYKSTNSKLLYPAMLTEVNGEWIINFVNSTKTSIKDVSIDIIGVIKDSDGKVLFEGNKFNVTVKGNVIIDYNYELCFDNHNKYYEYTWNGTTETITIPVKSIRHKLVNGMETEVEPVPYKVKFIKDNRESFDLAFSKNISSEGITIFPMETSEERAYKYEVKQEGSNKIANILLTYKTDVQKVNVKLVVEAECESITGDVWTNEGGYLMIDSEKKIPLGACWLFPLMKEKKDTVYNGNVKLSLGEHTFKTYNVLSMNGMNKTHKDCNVEKIINIGEDTDVIKLTLTL